MVEHGPGRATLEWFPIWALECFVFQFNGFMAFQYKKNAARFMHVVEHTLRVKTVAENSILLSLSTIARETIFSVDRICRDSVNVYFRFQIISRYHSVVNTLQICKNPIMTDYDSTQIKATDCV